MGLMARVSDASARAEALARERLKRMGFCNAYHEKISNLLYHEKTLINLACESWQHLAWRPLLALADGWHQHFFAKPLP
jgi:hypothetical protein